MLLLSRFWRLIALALVACEPTTEPITTTEPASAAATSDTLQGTYVGLEAFGADITPDDSTDRWFHENTLTIQDSAISLSQAPVVIRADGSKAYSASDGGFYVYKGKLVRRGGQSVAQLRLTNHDYVLVPYRLKNLADTALKISEEEKVKRGLYEADSSFFKREYTVEQRGQHVVVDQVIYSRPTGKLMSSHR